MISKSKVNKDSLLAYKFNGSSSRYEAGTDRDRILRRLDLIHELLDLYKQVSIMNFYVLLNLI